MYVNIFKNLISKIYILGSESSDEYNLLILQLSVFLVFLFLCLKTFILSKKLW